MADIDMRPHGFLTGRETIAQRLDSGPFDECHHECCREHRRHVPESRERLRESRNGKAHIDGKLNAVPDTDLDAFGRLGHASPPAWWLTTAAARRSTRLGDMGGTDHFV